MYTAVFYNYNAGQTHDDLQTKVNRDENVVKYGKSLNSMIFFGFSSEPIVVVPSARESLSLRSRESSVCSYILFQVRVFMSFSWENVLSTPAVCTGSTHIWIQSSSGGVSTEIMYDILVFHLSERIRKELPVAHSIPLSIHVGKLKFHLHHTSTVLLMFEIVYCHMP